MNIRRGGNGLLLIELFIALMFFSLAAAICLQLFIGAHNYSQEASDKSRAAIEAQNIAECFKAAHGDISETARLLGSPDYDGGAAAFYFDEDWNRADNSQGDRHYGASLSMTGNQDGLIRAWLEIGLVGNEEALVAFEVATLDTEDAV